MKIQITRPGVTDGYSFLDVGTVVEYPQSDAERLITEGYAQAVGTTAVADTVDIDDNTESNAEAAVKALNKLKLDKLIALAIEHDIEVAPDAKKADVVTAIIESGKSGEVLG